MVWLIHAKKTHRSRRINPLILWLYTPLRGIEPWLENEMINKMSHISISIATFILYWILLIFEYTCLEHFRMYIDSGFGRYYILFGLILGETIIILSLLFSILELKRKNSTTTYKYMVFAAFSTIACFSFIFNSFLLLIQLYITISGKHFMLMP